MRTRRPKRIILLLLACLSATACYFELHQGLQKRQQVQVERTQIIHQQAIDKAKAAQAKKQAAAQTALNRAHLDELKAAIGRRYSSSPSARYWLPSLRTLIVRRSWAVVGSTIARRSEAHRACVAILHAGGAWLRSVQVKGARLSARCQR